MDTRWILMVGILLTVLSSTEGRRNKGKGRAGSGNSNSTECLGESLPESKFVEGLAECTEELVPSKPISDSEDENPGSHRARKRAMKKNQMCIKLCQRKRQGVIDSSGKISETGANSFINQIFPQKAQRRIHRGLTRCAEDHGDGFTMANNCKEFRRFEKCFTRTIIKSCDMKTGKRKGARRGQKAQKGNNNRSAKVGDDETDGDDY